MSWTLVADVLAGVCLVLGAFLSLTAAIGLVRFPDLFTRMHAATKPQVLGLLLVLIGLGLRFRDPVDIGMLLLVAMFQLLTAPVSAHMLGRAAYRMGSTQDARLISDDLSADEQG